MQASYEDDVILGKCGRYLFQGVLEYGSAFS